MANQQATKYAQRAALEARDAKARLYSPEGAVELDGAGGAGLRQLAEAVELLALAVQAIGQRQP